MMTATAAPAPAPAPAGSRLCDRHEVKSRLKIGDTTYHHLIASGQLRSVKLGRRRLVRNDALEEFIAGLGNGTASQHTPAGRPAGG
jgi:excisionase family DNA binding protein